jgi:hypothetical protein
MMVNNRLLAVALTAGALVSAASAVGAPATRLGLAAPAQFRHEHAGRMFAHREANRYQRYGYGAYGAYAYGPYAAQDAAQPVYAEPESTPTPVVAVAGYNGDKVCPVVWRWSARAGQAVRSWSYCND